MIWPPAEKSRSTGALDGMPVLYFRNGCFTAGNLLRLSSCLQSSLRYKSSSWFTSLRAGAELVNAKNSSSVSSDDCRSAGSSVTRLDVILFIPCLSRFLAISLVWSSPHHHSRNWGKVTAASISSLSQKHPPNLTSIPFRTALAKGTAKLTVSLAFWTRLHKDIIQRSPEKSPPVKLAYPQYNVSERNVILHNKILKYQHNAAPDTT